MNFDLDSALENRAPRHEVRIEELTIQPQADARRMRVSLKLTPFRERPNIELLITDSIEIQVASVSIIEALDHRMSVMVHLRAHPAPGTLTLHASVLYPESSPVDQKTISFTLPEPS